MRILYGVCGEGFGHSSRARVLTNYLQRKGHVLKLITYGQAYSVLKDDFDCFEVKGLHIMFEKGVLKKRKTLFFNLDNFSKNILKSKKIYELMGTFKPDLCISDMEPVVPILRNWYKLPLISFDNQHRFTNLKLNIPPRYRKDFFIAKTVINQIISRADYYVVTSFTKEKIIKANTLLVSPIVRDSVKKVRSVQGEKILVYLTKKNRKIISSLKKIDCKFVVYGYNVKKKIKNLDFKTRESFLEDLRKCKAIIATSGFTLISEALYLKKPYLAIPLKGQFEQVLNALFLEQKGYGYFSESLDKKQIEEFILNIPRYRKNLKHYTIDEKVLFKTFDRILKDKKLFKKK